MNTKRLKHIIFSGITGILCTFGCTNQPNISATQPNIVFILVDDLGWADLSCYGSDLYETPNIDQLATQGVKFTQAYAAAPVCSPTRGSIMTGKYPASLHLTEHLRLFPYKLKPGDQMVPPPIVENMPLEEVTIAEVLKSAGYSTAHFGKWHLGGEGFLPTDQGFDINLGGKRSGMPGSYYHPFKSRNFEYPELAKLGKPGDYLTDLLTTQAVNYIAQHKDSSFFLYLPYFAVHTPVETKDSLLEKYQAKLASQPDRHQTNPHYAGMVETLDLNVGRVLAALNQYGIAENTIIILTSDNGGLVSEGGKNTPSTSNYPLRSGKGFLYEGGIRVPLIIRWPGVTESGKTYDEPVISNDFFTTIVEMAGLQSQTTTEGKSLVPLIKEQKPLEREAIYWHFPHYSNMEGSKPVAAMRKGDYKLIEFFEDDRLELYNLKNDIEEKHNLASTETETTQQLYTQLKAWQKSVNASMPTPIED